MQSVIIFTAFEGALFRAQRIWGCAA